MTNNNKTIYVFDNKEVVMTGRKAVKNTATLTPRRSDRTPKADDLYEIKPASDEDGNWTRWVKLADLYIIEEQNGDTDDKRIP